MLAERGISKETDRVWLRCLFKVGDKNNKAGGTLFERFEALLGGLGIELAYDEDERERTQEDGEEEGGREDRDGAGGEDRTGREKSDVETPTDARGIVGWGTPTPTDRPRRGKRRRASFNSMYDVTATADSTRWSAKRPSSRSSVSRLQVGKSPFPKSREEVPKGLADPGELSALTRRSGNPSCSSTITRTHDALATARSPLRAARRNCVTRAESAVN